MPRADAVARPLSGAAKASHTPALQLAAELNAAASALNNAPALLNLLSASQDVVRALRCFVLWRAGVRALRALIARVLPGRVSSRRFGIGALLPAQAAARAVPAGWWAGRGCSRRHAARMVRSGTRRTQSQSSRRPDGRLRDTYQTFLDRLRSLLCRPNVHGAAALRAVPACLR